MNYAHARGRYLAALGLSGIGAAFAAAGCHGAEPSATTPAPVESAVATVTVPAATATETAIATATATATATQTASPAPVGHHKEAWVPAFEPELPSAPNRPRCPQGPFCVPQPPSAGAASAPAPYQACAESVPVPAIVPARPGARAPSVTFDEKRTASERAGDPAACCYQWHVLCVGGRPLRGEEGPIVAASARRDDWIAEEGAVDVASLAPEVRAALAAHWEREAAFEHASVASFARASLSLLAASAPPDLLSATHAAAIDEVEHARLAYALASAYGGSARGPSSLAASLPATITTSALAVETFLDACAGESAAAAALREAAACAIDPAVRAVLDRIAADEERHAELAWRTVAWALRSGGEPVRRALAEALGALRDDATIVAPPGSDDLDLSIHGVLGPAAQEAVRRRALAEIVIPCAEALLAA